MIEEYHHVSQINKEAWEYMIGYTFFRSTKKRGST